MNPKQSDSTSRRLGVRLEDIVVVVPGGIRVLTGVDHELVIK